MKPIEAVYGYDAVGPGWKFILEALDRVMEQAIEQGRNRATNRPSSGVDPGQVSIRIDQIKEKFGGLRVYVTGLNMYTDLMDEVNGAINMAEHIAARFCEHCGSNDEVENRPVQETPRSWTLTLCRACHHRRDRAAQNPREYAWPGPDPVPAVELGIEGETK